jgi:predicted nucleotidyltransferase
MGTALGPAADAIGAALFGATRQGVLRTLFGHAERRFYQRQLIRMLGQGTGAVQRELVTLTQAGIVVRTVEGNQTYFQANPDSPVFAELRSLIRKTFGVAAVLQSALRPLAGTIRAAFIYGSVAVGREKAGSDIDVMVVGDRISLDDVVAAFADAQDAIGRVVNPAVYPTAEFCRKLTAGQHFLSSVIGGPKVFLIGNESELTGLAAVRVDRGAPGKPSGNRRPVRRGRSRS